MSREGVARAVVPRDLAEPDLPPCPRPLGTMLGLCASVQPLTRTLGPTVGGLLYRSFGVPIFGHVQFATNVLVLLVLWRLPLPQKTDKVR